MSEDIRSENSPSRPTILFMDLVGSMSLYRTIGDEQAERLVRLVLERSRDTIRRCEGRVIKSLGDGLLCLFKDASGAANAALELQRETRTEVTPGGALIQLRIGFFAGPFLERDGDLFGDAVNVAARLCGMAKPESILTTDTTSELLPRDLQTSLRVIDQTPVKGIKEPVTIVQLVWDRRSHTQILSRTSAGQTVVAFSLLLIYKELERRLSPANLPFVIGREPDCALVVAAPFASRHHARIEYRRGKFVLVDESTNGTYVTQLERPDAYPMYLRDESFPLLGDGFISLGAKIEQQADHVVRYAVT